MTQPQFKILADEHISNAIVEQLRKKGLTVERVIDVLEAGTPDPELLEYAYENNYTLLTQDEHIRKHINQRYSENKAHCGVFIAPKSQGSSGYGRIIAFVADYHELIEGGAATLEEDVYNRIEYID